jgi:long-chain acyl-CoA synthetase
MGAASIRDGADVKDYTRALEPSDTACQYTTEPRGAQFLCFRGSDTRESDHVLTALPLYHIFAFTVNFLSFFIRGAHNVLIPSPRPLTNLQKAFEKEPISVIIGVNTLFKRSVERTMVYCSSAEDPAHINRRRHGIARGGGLAMEEDHGNRGEGYGLSEASPALTFNPTERAKIGSIGVPLPSTELKCVDDRGRVRRAWRNLSRVGRR